LNDIFKLLISPNLMNLWCNYWYFMSLGMFLINTFNSSILLFIIIKSLSYGSPLHCLPSISKYLNSSHAFLKLMISSILMIAELKYLENSLLN
jgi:hypothetical protein